MRKFLLSFIALGLAGWAPVMAQQTAQFSQYMFYGLMYNPGYAGMDQGTRVLGAFRSQYTGYRSTVDAGGSQTTQLLSANHNLGNDLGGAGFTLVNDRIAGSIYTAANLNYAYHLKLGEGKLGLGLTLGLMNRGLDYTILRPEDKSDPNLRAGLQQSLNFTAGLGAFYTTENYYAGVSMQNVNRPKFDVSSSSDFTQARIYYITAGYHLPVGNELKVTPSILVKGEGGATSVDLNGLATYQDAYFAGLGFRSGAGGTGYTTESMVFMVGLNMLKNNNLRACYSLDGVGILGNSSALAPTSHEIHISYVLPVIQPKPRPIIRTPRYRK